MVSVIGQNLGSGQKETPGGHLRLKMSDLHFISQKLIRYCLHAFSFALSLLQEIFLSIIAVQPLTEEHI